MKLTWLGHSCFRVECEGYALVLDPYEPGSVPGCGDIHQEADGVLCSHSHHDHGYKEAVSLGGGGKEGAKGPNGHTDKSGRGPPERREENIK